MGRRETDMAGLSTLRTERDGSVLDTALTFFDDAADRLSLDEGLRRNLRHPKRSLIVSVPIRRDDGRMEIFEGYRVQHSIARGPAKGGIRYDVNASLEAAQAFAMLMTWKSAVVKIPFGGLYEHGVQNVAELRRHKSECGHVRDVPGARNVELAGVRAPDCERLVL